MINRRFYRQYGMIRACCCRASEPAVSSSLRPANDKRSICLHHTNVSPSVSRWHFKIANPRKILASLDTLNRIRRSYALVRYVPPSISNGKNAGDALHYHLATIWSFASVFQLSSGNQSDANTLALFALDCGFRSSLGVAILNSNGPIFLACLSGSSTIRE